MCKTRSQDRTVYSNQKKKKRKSVLLKKKTSKDVHSSLRAGHTSKPTLPSTSAAFWKKGAKISHQKHSLKKKKK